MAVSINFKSQDEFGSGLTLPLTHLNGIPLTEVLLLERTLTALAPVLSDFLGVAFAHALIKLVLQLLLLHSSLAILALM